MKKKSGLLGTAAMMAAMIVLAKALGLLRDILIGNLWGTTAEAIAYETASRLPILLFDFVLGGVVSAAFIPVFSDLLVREGKASAMRFASSYVNLILVLTGSLTLLGAVLASPLVSVLAPELTPLTHELAVSLTRILFPMVIATGLAFSFVGILQSLGEFRIPAIISLASNAIMVLYLVFFADRFGIYGLAVAMLLGWISQAVIQMPRLFSLGFSYSPRAGLRSPHIRRSLRLALPILIGTWTQPLCSVINTRFASAMEQGRAITALGYANRLYIILVGVFSFVATNLLFPYFSRSVAEGDVARSHRMIATSTKILTFIIAPIAVGVAVLAEPLVALLYERGAFSAADTALTAAALRAYAVGMVFMAANEVLTKGFFAEGEARIPMLTSLIAMAANIGLVFLLSPLGVSGIALASGAATALQCAVNGALMIRRGDGLSRHDAADIVKSLIAAALMGAAVFFTRPYLPEGKLVGLLLPTLIGVAVYGCAVLILRAESVMLLLSRIRAKKEGTR